MIIIIISSSSSSIKAMSQEVLKVEAKVGWVRVAVLEIEVLEKKVRVHLGDRLIPKGIRKGGSDQRNTFRSHF